MIFSIFVYGIVWGSLVNMALTSDWRIPHRPYGAIFSCLMLIGVLLQVMGY